MTKQELLKALRSAEKALGDLAESSRRIRNQFNRLGLPPQLSRTLQTQWGNPAREARERVAAAIAAETGPRFDPEKVARRCVPAK